MVRGAETLEVPSSLTVPGTVFAVDDEEPMRNAFRRLLSLSGFAVEVFASASEFLARAGHSRPACILLDINMPGMNGLDLQEELRARGVTMPVIFVTGSGSVAHAVTAMRAGAADLIEKPFNADDLLACIHKALAADRAAIQRGQETRRISDKVAALRPREKQVLVLLAQGLSNKLIARTLHVSPRTVEGYRARITDTLEVKAVADLVRIAQQCTLLLDVCAPGSGPPR
jgi:two-component system response regulator FixJ